MEANARQRMAWACAVRYFGAGVKATNDFVEYMASKYACMSDEQSRIEARKWLVDNFHVYPDVEADRRADQIDEDERIRSKFAESY